jgi:hypothetical protein
MIPFSRAAVQERENGGMTGIFRRAGSAMRVMISTVYQALSRGAQHGVAQLY